MYQPGEPDELAEAAQDTWTHFPSLCRIPGMGSLSAVIYPLSQCFLLHDESNEYLPDYKQQSSHHEGAQDACLLLSSRKAVTCPLYGEHVEVCQSYFLFAEV